MSTQCPLQLDKVSKKYLKGFKLWPTQDLTTIGDNSRTESVRVVVFVCDTPIKCPLQLDQVS